MGSQFRTCGECGRLTLNQRCDHPNCPTNHDHDHDKCCPYLRCAHPKCCGYYGQRDA